MGRGVGLDRHAEEPLCPLLDGEAQLGTGHLCPVHRKNSGAQDSAWHTCRCSVNIG